MSTCPQVYAATLAASRASSPSRVFARWRSKAKSSFSCHITPSMICRLPAAHRQASRGHARRALFCGGRRDVCAVLFQPATLPLHRGEALVGQEGVVPVGGHQELAYRALIAVRRGQTEGNDDPFGGHGQCYLETVHPFCLGRAAAEGSLTGKEALATGRGL